MYGLINVLTSILTYKKNLFIAQFCIILTLMYIRGIYTVAKNDNL